MGDFTLAPANTCIFGKTGSGKSTFALRYLCYPPEPVTCRFIFDDMGRAAPRLRVPPAYTSNQLEAALQTRWCVFNPHKMFPGDTTRAFLYFCDWAYRASCRGPGKKLFLVDEIWRFMSTQSIPKELGLVCQTGREENLELVCCTQTPSACNKSVVGSATEMVCFRLDDHSSLDWVEMYKFDRAEIENLPRGHFVSRNIESGEFLRGKVFG